MNWFNLSFVGWVILIVALAIAAYKLGMQPVWIAIGALAMLGIGIIVSVSQSKPQILTATKKPASRAGFFRSSSEVGYSVVTILRSTSTAASVESFSPVGMFRSGDHAPSLYIT